MLVSFFTKMLVYSAVVAALFAVHVAKSSEAHAAEPQVLNWGNGAEPKDLDPHIATGVPESHILMNIFEPLVGKHPKTLEPIPAAAESWKVSKDGRLYTFKLRANAKWSNGDPVTAQDFVYSWTRLLDPKTAAEYAYQGFYVKNGAAYNKGALKDPSQLGLKAIDARTFQVTLDHATPFFIGLLFHHSLYPVHRPTIEKFGTRWTRPENIVTNGPFVPTAWETNKVIRLTKSQTYWDKSTVALQTVNLFPTENLDTEEKMFRTGQLHVTNEVPYEKLPYWRKDKSGAFNSHSWLGIYYYRVNVTKPPLNDKRIRRALALAVDREKLTKYVTKGEEASATAFTPPHTAGYVPNSHLPKDGSRIEEAKRLLAEAGYPGGKGLPKLELLYNTHEGHKKTAEAIQQMWRANLGINVALYNQEWKVYLNSQSTLNYQISRSAWIGDYNDPNTFLDMFVTGGGNNQTGWSNKTYDELIAAAGRELNPSKRLALFRKAEDLLMEELPVIPLYVYNRNYLKSPNVVGWFNNIEDVHPLKFVSMGPREVAGAKTARE